MTGAEFAGIADERTASANNWNCRKVRRGGRADGVALGGDRVTVVLAIDGPAAIDIGIEQRARSPFGAVDGIGIGAGRRIGSAHGLVAGGGTEQAEERLPEDLAVGRVAGGVDSQGVPAVTEIGSWLARSRHAVLGEQARDAVGSEVDREIVAGQGDRGRGAGIEEVDAALGNACSRRVFSPYHKSSTYAISSACPLSPVARLCSSAGWSRRSG